mmetsp:Transcript_51390/g.121764  ORF Transcript_51390/g.121764 Transcript_51390/m.121764 type:complete len:299 (+) Transcript_51390:2550-3446(+)
MRRVRAQRHVDVLPRSMRRAVDREAQMVLDIARPEEVSVLISRHRPLHELVEHVLHRLAHHVHQHVEAAAVGHPNVDRLDAPLYRRVDHRLHAWDKRVDAFEAKALGGVVLGRQESLEAHRVDEAIEEAEGGSLVEVELLLLLELAPDPVLLSDVGNVRKLDAHRSAISLLHDRNDFAERLLGPRSGEPPGVPANRGVEPEGLVEVLFFEAVRAVVQELRRRLRLLGAAAVVELVDVQVCVVDAEGVQRAHVVPAHLEGAHEKEHLDVVRRHGPDLGLVDGLPVARPDRPLLLEILVP